MIPGVPGNPDPHPPVPDMEKIQTTRTTFQINNAKRYIPLVILYFKDNVKFLENINKDLKKQFFGTNIDLK